MTKKFRLFADGASRGNPGPGGAGVYLTDNKQNSIAEVAKYLGDKVTNNFAEYSALILGIETALEKKVQCLEIFMDSELVVRQILGQYQVKNKNLLPLFQKAKKLLAKIPSYTIQHVRRELNKEADHLSNVAIDQELRTPTKKAEM